MAEKTIEIKGTGEERKEASEIPVSQERRKGKERIREVDIGITAKAFTTFFRKFTEAGREYGNLNFKDISTLRQLLSNEKARILYTIKTRNPKSIYELAKTLRRDFKSVRKDIELLKYFGFVRFIPEQKGNRKSLKPVLNLDKLQITINLS